MYKKALKFCEALRALNLRMLSTTNNNIAAPMMRCRSVVLEKTKKLSYLFV
jgi:hypothetical protein